MKFFEAFQRMSSIHIHASLVLITICYVRTALILPPIGNCRIPCPSDINPVCGSNSVTYSNICNLRASACNLGIIIREVHSGHCDRVGGNRCPGFCNASYSPVCGRQLTYGNRCEFEHASCVYNFDPTVFREGVCMRGKTSTHCRRSCRRNWSPVCGSDGVTYDNKGCLRAENCNKKVKVHVVCYGECVKDGERLTCLPP